MKNTVKALMLGAVIIGTGGCTSIVTERADLAQVPDGVRIYPPKVYVLVDTTEKKTTIAYLPDYKRAYDIRPRTVFAKQDFKVETEDGQLKTLTANQDTTAALTFISGGATLAAKAAGVGVSATVINGTFGLESGIYELGDDNVFHKIPAIK